MTVLSAKQVAEFLVRHIDEKQMNALYDAVCEIAENAEDNAFESNNANVIRQQKDVAKTAYAVQYGLDQARRAVKGAEF